MPPLIRSLHPGELALASDFPAREGWTSETPEMFEGFLAHDPNGFLAAEENGRLVGICAATSYGNSGFIGELIVLREARGRGLGPALLDAAVGYLKSRGAEHIYLDAVRKAAPFYELSGFRPVCRSLRFAGWADEVVLPDTRDENGALRPMETDDLPAVCALDLEAFGADRSFFLKRRRALHPEFAWVLEEAAGIAGYILGHPGNDIVVAAPLIAAGRCLSPFRLLGPFLARVGERRFRAGVLETNTASVRFFRSLPGLTEFRPSIRMVLGDSSRLGDSPMCLAIGSPAKG
ncbi:MAG: GNAT family N-acetyltransferase [Candidatus Aminicenantes bacterium]|nr:GNAT family N-acetyltransferase [Candidatus Aminicenantes bacterium]